MNDLARRIDAALPQTQCTRCGYPDCASYAQAIADGEAGINQCPPGGAEGIERLSALTGQPVRALDHRFGIEGPVTVAVIDEAWCIGCTLCIQACPTDAILGIHKRMHTVVEPYCTGCELCLPVCPVDCISLEIVSGERTGWQAWSAEQAAQGRERYSLRQQRLAREKREHEVRLETKAREKLADLAAHSKISDEAVLDKKRAVIEAALARSRARRGQTGG
ncbi:MAG: electron transport complex subunit RsxB [Hydrogenophaga sp.]|uniref:electron transport complex subunit RsxB n=1 Tax=Hydrogenophaga sp. TaxID=1904254 RepID=UPI00403612DA